MYKNSVWDWQSVKLPSQTPPSLQSPPRSPNHGPGAIRIFKARRQVDLRQCMAFWGDKHGGFGTASDIHQFWKAPIV